MSIYDVNANEHIEKIAEKLKEEKNIVAPKWAPFVKTGHFKQRNPERQDWWHVRTAAVLRTVARMGPIGTSKLRTKYGGKKNRGVASEHTYRGSGSIIRKVLQQLEKAELIKQVQKGVHKGRVVTPKGQSILDKTALSLNKPTKKKAVVEKKEPKKTTKKAE